jgi:hypothetical protein
VSKTPNCGPTAGASGEPDPIFAAIDRHRAALRGWLAAYDRLVLQEMMPPEAPPDAPEWIEANTAFLAAIQELGKALKVVLSTPPTTIAGVADLLDYVGRDAWELVISLKSADADLWCDFHGTVLETAFNNSVEGVYKAAADFLPMIAARLLRRATGEPDPIFAAIDRHRAALRGWLAAGEQVWQEMIPPEVETAVEELHKALEALLSTPPTTIAGVADLLDYVGRDAWELVISLKSADADLCNSGDFDGTVLENAFGSSVEGVQKAADNFLQMVAATLRSLTAGPS